MKTYLHPILKALGLTVALDGMLMLFIYVAAPLAILEIGQAFLFGGLTLLLTAATCLYANISVEKRRSLWLSLAVAAPAHLILSVISILVYTNRLASNWPGSDYFLTWLLFLLLSLTVWWIAIFSITVTRSSRIGGAAREQKRRIRLAQKGFRPETAPLTPGRARAIAILKGVLWVLWLHILTGLFLEFFTEIGVANTILSYVAFPALWCVMAAVYGLLDGHNRTAFTLSVAITHLVCFFLVMLFLLPGNILEHPYYAVKYLDDVISDPFGHSEQLMILMLFLLVWVVMGIFGAARRKARASDQPETNHIPNTITIS
ncbi:MAG: hypothetical protein IJX72_02960 [Clostridia bacterium]|nr:hypothetical protein [Clostridia bacterium]